LTSIADICSEARTILSTAAPTKSGDFTLARPAGTCSATHRPIAPDEVFIAALRETPAGFERLDIKLDAWDDFPRTDIVGFWKMTMPRAEVKKKLLVDDAVLLDLLLRLQDTTQVEKLCFRFVLALILMRKKLVIYEDTKHDEQGRELWTMRVRGREGNFTVIDPKPTDEQIASVRDQLGQIVNEDA
jgi:hypothetical protein